MNPAKPFILKRNDTLPTLTINIQTKGQFNQVIPYNLSAVTACTFSMSDEFGNLKVSSASSTIVSSSGGTVQYTWSSLDTNTSGRYRGEFELLMTAGNKMTIPNLGYIDIEIIDDINGS